MANWTTVSLGIRLFRDSCNVYAVDVPDGTVIVDAGTGAWLDRLNELNANPVALLCTHYFRDHSAGAAEAARRGIPIYVPEYEQAIFTDPEQHFRQRETYIIYDNLWDLYAPVEPIPLTGLLRDYERIELGGATFEVVPLPGATLTQSGVAVTLADDRKAIFCGEAIHSPGRLPRVAPLQYNYNDLPGAVQCAFSVRELNTHTPDLLLPSLGEPILDNVDDALSLLDLNLRNLLSVRPTALAVVDHMDSDPLQRITDHVWLDRHSVANTWFVISDSGKALAIDYGYHKTTVDAWQGYPKPERRRALLHGLDGLKRQFGIDRIDVVLVSHFHDDHVCGIPVLQRLFGTECWAAENFADLLAHPEAHCFPCNWPVPAHIDRQMPLDEPFTWEEYTFTLHPMNGHTRFASLIGFEADGKCFAHTGDQYFFDDWDGKSGFENVRRRSQNHVYRNGALLDGYRESGNWMFRWRPDIVLQGHQPAMFTDEYFFAHIAAWNFDYAELHRFILPIGNDEIHFNLDSWAGWIRPYRTRLNEPGPIAVEVTVRNPLPTSATATVRLVGPPGWDGEIGNVELEPRAEGALTLSIVPAGRCRRQPFTAELTIDDHNYGQVAEALATIGHERF